MKRKNKIKRVSLKRKVLLIFSGKTEKFNFTIKMEIRICQFRAAEICSEIAPPMRTRARVNLLSLKIECEKSPTENQKELKIGEEIKIFLFR